MRNFIASLIAILLSTSAIAVAASELEVLNEMQRFRRASIILRNRGLYEWEISRIENTPTGAAREKLFHEMTDAFIASDEFSERMIENLSDLFRVKSPTESIYSNGKFTSLHLKFLNLVDNNESWDNLLTSRVVTLTRDDLERRIGVEFFAPVLNAEEKAKLRDYVIRENLQRTKNSAGSKFVGLKYEKAESASLPIENPNLAGVITDPSYLDRYPTTPVNQHRKRAASVFRAFLCDEMRAVILPDSASEREIEEAALDEIKGKRVKAPVGHANLKERHANDEKCVACHYKLDPLANVFKGISDRLTSRPIPGHLQFKRRDGSMVKVAFKNPQELANAIAAQPEYVSCQVRHFWSWFVGNDIPLSAKLERELVEKFNQVGRRPKDFAKHLVTRPEFYKFPKLTLESVNVNHVSGILQDCNSCHSNDITGDAPDLGSIPFQKFGSVQHHSTIESLIKDLDLLGDGSKSVMPPKSAGWKLKGPERDMLTAWLAAGAKDSEGQITWNNPELQAKLNDKLVSQKVKFELLPTFDYTAKRRLTPKAMRNTLEFLLSNITVRPNYSMVSNEVFKSRNLDTGAVIITPPPLYNQMIYSIGHGFTFGMNTGIWTKEELDSLGLGFLETFFEQANARYFCKADLNQPEPQPDCFEPVDITRRIEMRLKIALTLHKKLLGWSPQPGTVEYDRLVRYAQKDRKDNAYLNQNNAPAYIQEMLKQLVLTTQFLTY